MFVCVCVCVWGGGVALASEILFLHAGVVPSTGLCCARKRDVDKKLAITGA